MPFRPLSPVLRRATWISMAALGAPAAGPQARAQTAPAPPNRTVNLNYVHAADLGFGGYFEERYVALQVGGEIRRPLGFKIGEWAPDLGLYAGTYYYPEPLVFSRFLRSPLRVANQGEIAFSIGSATPFQMLGLSNPRIGVGYVFGDGLNVWHVNFGFPF